MGAERRAYSHATTGVGRLGSWVEQRTRILSSTPTNKVEQEKDAESMICMDRCGPPIIAPAAVEALQLGKAVPCTVLQFTLAPAYPPPSPCSGPTYMCGPATTPIIAALYQPGVSSNTIHSIISVSSLTAHPSISPEPWQPCPPAVRAAAAAATLLQLSSTVLCRCQCSSVRCCCCCLGRMVWLHAVARHVRHSVHESWWARRRAAKAP